MKDWNYHNYKGRRFYRLNHAKMSKSMFFLSYYRILHTAYLKRQRYCIAAVKRMFVETFGHEPDAWSISYITDTEKCFVNDTITEALNKDGKILCPECLRQMLIEIGFDVYLIQTAGKDEKPDRKAFYQWLPMKKDRSLKKAVKCFWKERLPKEKLLFNLYYQLEPYKREILATYRKILLENDTLLIQTAEKDSVLAYIDENSAVSLSFEENVQDNTASVTTLVESDDICIEEENSEIADNEEIVSVVSEASETIAISVAQPSEETVEVQEESEQVEQTVEVLEESEQVEQTVVLPEPEEILPIAITDESEPVIVNMSSRPSNVQKRKRVAVPDGRGFKEKNKMTRKKAVTCAVCVAAAGALLVPLVAYTVIKHKAA